MSHWLQGLNPEQSLAAAHNEGPLLILAGAGSGKTTVLVSRAGRLLGDRVCKPEEMTVLTFTNRAAKELKARVHLKLGRLAKSLWAGTFHSFGLEIIKKYHHQLGLPEKFSILDSSDSQSILKEIMTDISVAGKDAFSVEKLLSLINTWRANPKKNIIGEEDYLALAEVLMPRYEKKMDILGAVDFEGLLLKPIRLFRSEEAILNQVRLRSRYLMVDEFQDTNNLQMEFIDFLAQPLCNITVVGDDDQSIYGWRGAEIQNILQFPKRYKNCQVVKLERNYRSSPAIVAVANEVIKNNANRHGKILRAEITDDSGNIPEVFNCETEDEECEWVVQQIKYFESLGHKPAEVAILFRSNSQGALLEGALRRYQIRYKITGSNTLFDRKEVKEAMAYLRSVIAPSNFSMKRIINVPPRGIGDSVLEVLQGECLSKKIHFYDLVKNVDMLPVNDKVKENLKTFNNGVMEVRAELINRDSPLSPGQVFAKYLTEIGLKAQILKLNASSNKKDTGDKHWVLVEIFCRILDTFIQNSERSLKGFNEFLDAMELRDIDSSTQKEDEIQLLTMHASKGLEFPVVMVIGVEEDIIPHKVLGTDHNEERRLFYVALTRAKKYLLLSRCLQRQKYGRLQVSAGSRFLYEIPSHLVNQYESIYRPVSGDQRQNLVSDFMSKLQNKINKNPVKS
jgi:DNA helicase-2/ATP-dependent DNA helicase PcrA